MRQLHGLTKKPIMEENETMAAFKWQKARCIEKNLLQRALYLML